MSHLSYATWEGYDELTRGVPGNSQAVRIGNIIEISGQGGWDRATEEISPDRKEEFDQAFANVEHSIQQAGGTGLKQVYKLRIFLINWDEQAGKDVITALRKWMPTHRPCVTLIGVVKLYGKMTIEIEANAHLV